jgi:hypothetical protein
MCNAHHVRPSEKQSKKRSFKKEKEKNRARSNLRFSSVHHVICNNAIFRHSFELDWSFSFWTTQQKESRK